jgi:hypothetical protein
MRELALAEALDILGGTAFTYVWDSSLGLRGVGHIINPTAVEFTTQENIRTGVSVNLTGSKSISFALSSVKRIELNQGGLDFYIASRKKNVTGGLKRIRFSYYMPH